jgi:hypothetical protein
MLRSIFLHQKLKNLRTPKTSRVHAQQRLQPSHCLRPPMPHKLVRLLVFMVAHTVLLKQHLGAESAH